MSCLLILACAFSPGARAQEPSGPQILAAMESTMVDAIAKAEKSVVALYRVKRGDRDANGRVERAFDPFGRPGRPFNQPNPGDWGYIPSEYATGVVIDAQGLILTNHHVLAPESDYYVTTADRKVYAAHVKAADPRSDLAVLEIAARRLAPMTLGNAATLKKGQIVIALGNPYAIAADGQVSASWGIVANLSRKAGPSTDPEVPRGRSTLHQFGTLIQTDAKLNLGTSGGALVNLKGEMIGLTTSLAAVAGYEQAAGYAIPIDDTFRRVIETLKKGREVEYGFLGVSPKDLPNPDRLAGKRGTYIESVYARTPADRAGLQPSDVITHVNDQPVYDVDSFMLQVGSLPAEAAAKLTVLHRDGRVDLRNVQLAKFRVLGMKIVTTPSPSWRGVRVDHWTALFDPQQTRRMEVGQEDCVVLSEVAKDSPAWRAGLRPETLVTHVAGKRVGTPKEFHAAVAGKSGPVSLRLIVPTADRVERVTRAVPAE